MSPPRQERSHIAVLVVEDNSDLRRVIQEILEFEGFYVQGAANGTDAIRILEAATNLPQLIISDVLMGGMDGCEFLRMVKSSSAWANIPIVIVTGAVRRETDCDDLISQADGYVEKPFSIEQLVLAAQAALR